MMTAEHEKRVEDAREKQEMMIKWFEDQKDKLPPVPFRVNKWSTILNFDTFITVSACRLRATQPLSRMWRIIYMRLYELKKLLSNE